MPAPLTAVAIDRLLENAAVWRGGTRARISTQPTGFPSLDAGLPGGGWPVGALSELLPLCSGIGELSLLVPTLRAICAQGRPVVLVSPPHVPYAPALARAGIALQSMYCVHTSVERHAHWTAEQVLREGTVGAVLLWSATTNERALRRLQLAAEAGLNLAFLYRPLATLRQSSPAAVRMVLQPQDEQLCVQIVKARGAFPKRLTVPLPRMA